MATLPTTCAGSTDPMDPTGLTPLYCRHRRTQGLMTVRTTTTACRLPHRLQRPPAADRPFRVPSRPAPEVGAPATRRRRRRMTWFTWRAQTEAAVPETEDPHQVLHWHCHSHRVGPRTGAPHLVTISSNCLPLRSREGVHFERFSSHHQIYEKKVI